ncbi:hypothetical protein [Mesoflavibacter zeaxanthinifaciens]|jgi:hypothetical protein|uniref:hypothetical protein n=1 Tax=Mesoflavibacter zeaxanthinifaciens TaxID=393060 RepID=UPI003A932E54
MININIRAASKARIIHLNELRNKILRSRHLNSLPNYLIDFIKKYLDEILAGTPKQIERLNAKYYKIQKSSNKRKYDAKLRKIFSYSNFNKSKKEYNLNNLADNVSIQYCPYCNRQSIISVTANSIKPDFDHFFPQSKYPLFGLSFFNLIPSCTICNSRLKSGKVLRLKQYIHPYLDKTLGEYRFSYKYDIETKNLIKINLKIDPNSNDKTKIKNTFSLFKIIESYNAHTDEIVDLIKIKQIYSDRYLKILATQTYQDLKVSEKELYRLAFGVYFDDSDFSKRPFSKLKKDILSELNIIENERLFLR